ncbi:MAG: DMT family transporter [Candidatus Gastranaerophilales bacterium]|nr:DMT family transporter [Candidatus Gastranaerophilales bacterium]
MNNIVTVFFLLIRIISNPLANVFQKKLSYTIPAQTINFYTYLILSVIYLPFGLKYFNLMQYNINFWFLIIFAGLLCALGSVFLIKAINIGELSVLGPVNSYKSVVGLISALIILKEIPSIYGIIGILLIICGSWIIFDTTKEGFSLALLKRKDIQYRISALILTGIEAAVLKQIIVLSSIEVCFLFWCLSGLFWSLIINIVSKQNLSINKSNTFFNFFHILLISICLGLMQYSTNYVFLNMPVGSALALFQLSSILTVFFGYKFFKEKDLFKKLAGSIIMAAGSCLIFL